MSLQSLISILLARKWALIHTTLLALVMALVAIVITPKTYTASTDLLVDGRGLDPISGQSQPGRLTGGYTATQADIIRSRNVASKVIEKLALQQSPAMIKAAKLSGDPVQDKGRMLYFLAQGLMVVPKRDSSVLSITFQAQDPAFAAQLADAFAQAYMYTTLELRVEPAKQTSLWYKEQLTGLRAELIEKQDALSNYQEAHNIIATSDRLDLESAKLAELSSMLITVQSERLNSQSRSDQIEGTKRGQAEFQALNNPQVQRLSADLAQAQARVSELANQVGENHPQYKQAQSDVSSLQKQMNKMLEMINGSLKSSVALSQTLEDQLKTDIAEQKARVLLLSRNRNELTLLKQEVDNAQSAYDAALARSAQSRLESQIAATDVAVLNSALPPRSPTSPKPALALTLACIAGLLLGTALALCWEWLDQRIRTPADLEEGLGLAVLAYIPAEFSQKHTRPGLASPS